MAHPMSDWSTMPPGAVGAMPAVLGQVEPAAAPGQLLQLVRLELAPDGSINAHTHPGTIVVCLESGSAIFGVLEGTATVTRSATVATPEAAEQLTANTETVLGPGDCLTFDATQTIHNLRGNGEPAVFWQAQLYAAGEKPTTFLATPEA
jgi:mannose-6-phosphate isomerase-like protein (cupin superfamily)